MDFKSLLTKISEWDDKIETVAAPVLPKSVQLNEDAELRVLAGTSSYIAEAKKMKDEKKEEKKEVEEGFEAGDKVGSTKKTATGTLTKTATGVKHTRDKFEYDPGSDDKDDKKRKEKARKSAKESVDPEAFKAKFAKMVEGKKGSKPDFLDMDKDGDKKEPMKKAIADKKKKPVGEGKDEGKPGKNFAKIAKKAAKEYGSKEAGERVAGAVRKKVLAKESKMVAESVEGKLSLKDMLRIVKESGGQQQIDPVDQALWNWANRVASTKITEGGEKAEIFAAMIYERNGGVFEMYDVLAEDQK